MEEERVHYYKTRAVAGGGGGGGDNNSATTTPPPLSEAELVSRIADIEEKQFKLKRRILGNTRFVGELYQVGLVTTNIIHGCIAELLGTPGEWKTVNDEQVILCLCHLITTTGEKLDQKTTHDGKLRGKLNDAYERMRVLSKDKSVNSRMRFSIEEVLNLRENKWQRRRAEEGPLKISEIHQKIIEEEARQQQQEMHHGGGRGFKYQQQQPSTQQQQQQQQTQKSILTRPKSQDVRKQQQQSGGPQQDAAVASAAVVVEQEKGFGRTLSGSTYSDKPSSSSSSSRGGDPLKRSNSDSHPRPINGKISMEAVTNTATATVDVVTTVTSSSSSSIRFDDGKMQNNVKSMLSEYLETNDVSEVLLSLEESHSKAIYGYFVLHVLDRCNNATKVDNKVETILSLLANSSLVSLLLGAKQEIAAALFFSEELKCLVDTTMDIKEVRRKMKKKDLPCHLLHLPVYLDSPTSFIITIIYLTALTGSGADGSCDIASITSEYNIDGADPTAGGAGEAALLGRMLELSGGLRPHIQSVFIGVTTQRRRLALTLPTYLQYLPTYLPTIPVHNSE